MSKPRLTAKQTAALKIAAQHGRVIQERGDGFDQYRPDHAGRTTLESLRARGLLAEYEGPRYMPTYVLTDAGQEAIEEG